MKKIYAILLILGISLTAGAQSFILENFSSGEMPPAGWTIDNLEDQWSVDNGNTAGGIAPEGKFTYTSGTHATRFISPVVDLTGIASVSFSFRHFYDDYTGAGPVLGVATRSGGGDWESVWEIDPTSNVGPEQVTFDISNADVGQADFQFSFYLEGNMYNIDYWFVDDIWLYNALNVDVNVDGITMDRYNTGEAEVTARLRNLGLNAINSFDAHWKANDGDWQTTSLTGLNIDFGETYDFVCDQMFDFPIGDYDLTVMVDNVNGTNDEDPSNNEMTKEVVVVSHSEYRKVCFEEFTSSTCAPCATLNASFVPWCEDHEEEISLLKYQMNWPGSGDPYYTEEGATRRYYYGVNSVPNVVVNGENIGHQFSGVQPAFDNAVLQPGLFSIAGSHHLDGTEMTVEANLVPYTNFDQFTVQIAVFEYLTTENATTNGETEFEHVMMKMVPDAEGTTVNFTDRESVNITETVDLTGTFVEEWDDLGVIIFIQDNVSKEVFQSAYSTEDANYNNDALLQDITIDGESLTDFDPNVFEYEIELEEGTSVVPVVIGDPNDENALVIDIPATELPGSTSIDVFAEDRYTKQTYTINFLLATGVAEHQSTIKLFPNPATDRLYISGTSFEEVKVFDVLGKLVKNHHNSGSNYISISDLENGVYMIQISMEDNSVLTRKISVKK